MMTKPVKIEVTGLRASAAKFEDVADKTKHLLDTLKSTTGSKGEAWGNDKSGKKFADGEKGYKKNRDSIFESIAKVAEVFEANANNLRDSAKLYEENERATADQLQTRADRMVMPVRRTKTDRMERG
ncbi:WXG100 family type VII secretion target [Nocardia brasiliensis]|uniref:WXG100 family type VII secretion target n=2 Tax=Nocardia brasiliensis TaxID=37326 RepID=UPI0024544921|nr:type VII secretion target [Nocardia brasiliensis]